jgi:predicted DNA-binding transcriptional regulator YafY
MKTDNTDGTGTYGMVARLAKFAQPLQRPEGDFFQPKREASGLGVSKRTLTRDMEFLAGLGYVFEYDRQAQMYWGKAPARRVL